MKRFACVIVVCLGLAYASNVPAAVIYSQAMPAEPHAAFASSESFPISQKIADNFAFDGDQDKVVRSLRFIGGSNTSDALTDNFHIVFLEDGGGLPGLPIQGGDFSIGQAFSSSPTGGQLLNGVTSPILYAVNLPQEVRFSPNTTYWVSITNSPLLSPGWIWARSQGTFDTRIASTTNEITTGPWVQGNSSGGMWFELNNHNIPEPSTLTFLLIGLFAAAVYGGRS